MLAAKAIVVCLSARLRYDRSYQAEMRVGSADDGGRRGITAAEPAWLSQLPFDTDVGHHRRSFQHPHPHPSPPATMKLSWAVFFSSLYCTASAARPSVSPETARLIIAHRLGLSRFHSIEHADAEAIRHLNAYGGAQQKLFGQDDEDRSKAHLLLWIEDGDVEEATGAPLLPAYRQGRILTVSSSARQ
jgi:hypothetical protein